MIILNDDCYMIFLMIVSCFVVGKEISHKICAFNFLVVFLYDSFILINYCVKLGLSIVPKVEFITIGFLKNP